MDKKPNIVFILNDHQAYHGHGVGNSQGPLRPNFEAFAKTGVEFENAYCVTPMCGPARRSLLTGLYPHTHGQVHNENDPEYRHDVYLDLLAEGGYRNFYYGKWHAGPGCAYDHHCQGLSETGYGNPYNSRAYADYLKKKGLPRAQHKVKRVIEQVTFGPQGFFPKLKEGALYQCEDYWCGEHAYGVTVTPKETHESFFLAELACEKLEELAKEKSDRPFHLRVDFWGPHQPYFPTQEFLDLYDPKKIAELQNFDTDLRDKPETLKMELNKPMGDGAHLIYPNPIPWEEWQEMLAHCYAHITMVDAAGGRILRKLRELGLDENTLIIWSTDHGDAIACQGGHFDKDSHMAQEVMRIPLAVSWKDRIPSGQKNDRLVCTCDIPATFMDAADIPFGNPIDGESLLPLAEGKKTDWRKSLLCETYGHGYGVTIRGRMVTDGRYKYVCTEHCLDELYDLREDPFEKRNLAMLEKYRGLKEAMRKLLAEKQRESADPIPMESLLDGADAWGERSEEHPKKEEG